MITFKRCVRRSEKGREGIKRMVSVLIIKRQVISFLEWHPKVPDLSEPGVQGVAWQILADQLPGGGGQIMPTKLQQALPDFQTFLGPCFLFLNCPRLSTNPSNFGDPIGTCTFFQVKKMRKESFA